MEDELNYLSNKIEEKECEIEYWKRDLINTKNKPYQMELTGKIDSTSKELCLLENILSVVTNHELLESTSKNF